MKHVISVFFVLFVFVATALGAETISKTIPAPLKGSWKVVASEKAGSEKEEFTRADLDVPMGDIVQFNTQVSLNGRRACGTDLLIHLNTGSDQIFKIRTDIFKEYDIDYDLEEILKKCKNKSNFAVKASYFTSLPQYTVNCKSSEKNLPTLYFVVDEKTIVATLGGRYLCLKKQ